MAPFRFRLTTLLRMRQVSRDQCRQDLADRQRGEARIAHRIAQLDAAFAQLRERAAQASRPGLIDVAALRQAQRYEHALESQHAEAACEHQDATSQVEAARATLVEADRDVKTLEKLRDTQQQVHRRQNDRREHQQLDEFQSLRRGS